MKKIFALCCTLLLVAAMALMAVSCGDDPQQDKHDPFGGEGIEGPIIDVE